MGECHLLFIPSLSFPHKDNWKFSVSTRMYTSKKERLVKDWNWMSTNRHHSFQNPGSLDPANEYLQLNGYSRNLLRALEAVGTLSNTGLQTSHNFERSSLLRFPTRRAFSHIKRWKNLRTRYFFVR